jgi:uncharacterized protein YaiI (UPF0178 family)
VNPWASKLVDRVIKILAKGQVFKKDFIRETLFNQIDSAKLRATGKAQ